MDLLKILRSFEEFLFEVVTWLFFYPRTLWRIVWRPHSMMAYAESEERQPEENRFDDALSPPMLLLVTLLVGNAVGWAAHVARPPEASQLSHALFSSEQNLLLFRCLIFSLIPLVAALTLLRKQGVPIARLSLRKPFYAQCYLAAPFALASSLGAIGLQRSGWYADAGLAVLAICTAWLLSVQTRWFQQYLQIGVLAALSTAIWAFIRAIIYLLLIILPVALF